MSKPVVTSVTSSALENIKEEHGRIICRLQRQ